MASGQHTGQLQQRHTPESDRGPQPQLQQGPHQDTQRETQQSPRRVMYVDPNQTVPWYRPVDRSGAMASETLSHLHFSDNPWLGICAAGLDSRIPEQDIAIIQGLSADTLVDVSRRRADLDGSTYPCRFGWPQAGHNKVVVPVRFADGLVWDVHFPSLPGYDDRADGHLPAVQETVDAMQRLRPVLQTAIPRVIDSSAGRSNLFGRPFMMLPPTPPEGIGMDRMLDTALGGSLTDGEADQCLLRLLQCIGDVARLRCDVGRAVFAQPGAPRFGDGGELVGMEDRGVGRALELLASGLCDDRASTPTQRRRPEGRLRWDAHERRQLGLAIETCLSGADHDTADYPLCLDVAPRNVTANRHDGRLVSLIPDFVFDGRPQLYATHGPVGRDGFPQVVGRDVSGPRDVYDDCAQPWLSHASRCSPTDQRRNALGQSAREFNAFIRSAYRLYFDQYANHGRAISPSEALCRLPPLRRCEGLDDVRQVDCGELLNWYTADDEKEWSVFKAELIERERARRVRSGDSQDAPDVATLGPTYMYAEDLIFYRRRPAAPISARVAVAGRPLPAGG